jgi:hypothetical protein
MDFFEHLWCLHPILYELAITERVDYFITNDKKALKKLGNKKLPIVSTTDFLNKMEV